MSINSVEISGNLTRDCEVRQTALGRYVYTFGVAVSDRRRDQQGNWENYAHFVDCVLFDNEQGTKAWIARNLRKGFKVFVRGKLNYSSWTDKDTQKTRSKLEVIVNEIDAVWPPKQDAAYGAGYYATAGPQQGQQQYYPQQAPIPPQAARVPAQMPPQAAQGPTQAPMPPQTASYPQQPQYGAQTGYQQPTAPQQGYQQPPVPQQGQQQIDDLYDEDIPF